MTLSAVVALSVIGFARPAEATLSISVPASAALGSTSVTSSTKSAQLGTVTASANGLTLAFTATVATTVFTTGGRSANETIGKSQIFYWSGPATGTTGTLLTSTPGQSSAANAVALTAAAVAYTASGAVAFSVSWNPTVVVHIPTNAVAGTYTGTITHSVA
ncbi:MAG: hypothetical protein QOG90_1847 [Actinomycetota bacterium]|jgi:hypothetical protein